MGFNEITSLRIAQNGIRISGLHLFAVAALLFGLGCSDSKEGVRPKVATLTESVYASVTLEPTGMYEVFAASSGILENIFIEEGDSVGIGQVIAQIKADNPSVLRDNAQLNAELARENYLGQSNMLGTLNEEIATLKEQLHLDSLNFSRLSRLWSQNIGSKSELETAELRYQTKKNNLEILKGRYEQTQNDLENRYRQAQNALKQAQTSLGEYEITSRMDGKVYSLLKEAGESINAQQPLAQIGHSEKFIIDMSIDEVDIARVHMGQKVWVTLDAYEGEVFEAVITRILPLKDTRTQTFSVEGVFTQAPAVLYAGLSGEANIVLRTKDNVLTIPMDLLIDGTKVLTSEGEVAVRTGLRNLEQVEIISGIDSTTVLHRPE